MAATRIMSIHINKGKTARQCIGERLDYIMNPKKTDGGILVSTYACSPETAADEFMLFRQEYQQNTGRTQENEVIGYHVGRLSSRKRSRRRKQTRSEKSWPPG